MNPFGLKRERLEIEGRGDAESLVRRAENSARGNSSLDKGRVVRELEPVAISIEARERESVFVCLTLTGCVESGAVQKAKRSLRLYLRFASGGC